MSNYKTQCPHCKTIYPMPEAKLSCADAKASCGKCKHSFLLNNHLINEAASLPPTSRPAPSPKTPKPAKPKKQVIADDLIFDHMEIGDEPDEVSFSDDELNAFMSNAVVVDTPIIAATAKDSGQHTDDDEAWLNNLLKNETAPDTPEIIKSQPDDDLSELIGADLETLIPEEHNQDSLEAIHQRMQARLAHTTPTQEQLVKQRGIGYYLTWTLASVLMLLLAAVQYAIFNTHTIAKSPTQAALVRSLCSFCALPAAEPSAFHTGYTLQDGMADRTTDMIATIKNISPTDQVYPNIKVSIQGENGLIGELALSPKEYLEIEQTILATSSEGRFMLTLDTPQKDIKAITITPFY